MEEENTQHHSKEVFFYLISYILKSAGFYGMRAVIILYMISETMNMDMSDAIDTYAWFTSLLIISHIAGAVLGDLVIGNKKSIIYGGIIQAIGAFCLCIPAFEGFYFGLILIVIGGGLFSPNITANFGKLYFDRKRLLDLAYSSYYLAMNIGAFIGIFSISYLGEEYGWNVGFITAGVLMLLSIVPIIGIGDDRKQFMESVVVTLKSRNINIIISVVLVAVFWSIYEMSGFRLTTLRLNLAEVSNLEIPLSIWTGFQSFALFPVLIILIVLWAYFYSSYQFKLMIGFLFGAASLAVLLFIPEVPGDQHVYLYFGSLLLLVLSEAHIAPILNSVVAKYADPKYLAIVFSLIFIPTRFGSAIIGAFNERINDHPILALTIGMLTMLLIGVGIAVFLLVRKK